MIVHFWHTSKQPSSRWPFCTFGLTIILKKTEVYQKPPQGIYRPPKFNIDGHPLNAVDQFINLGSITSNNVSITKDMDNRLAKACSPFGRPQKPVWQNHSLRLTTKIQVYKTVVLSTLLYWSESWVLYRKHTQLLERFHQRCLRSIMGSQWQDYKTNTEVLEWAGLPSIEAILL